MCSYDETNIFWYFHTPDYFKLSANILSVLSIPLGIYGLLVIYMATPRRMKEGKLVLFHYQLWIVILDMTMNLFFAPFPFFPFVALKLMGLWERVGIPFRVQVYLQQRFLNCMGISLIMLFENRHNAIGTIRFCITRPRSRYCLYLLNYLIAVGIHVPYYLDNVDTLEVKQQMLKEVPCLSPEIFSDDAHVLTRKNSHWPLTIVTFQMLVLGVQACFFAFHSAYHLLYVHNVTMSTATRRLQKKFLLALIFQIVLPGVIVIVPLLIMAVSMVSGSYNQARNSNTMLVVSSHGLLSTIFLLLIHEPYRSFTKNLICHQTYKRKSNSERTTAVINSVAWK